MFEALQKYAQFTGRSDRKEYWMFVLLYFIVAVVASIIDSIVARDSAFRPVSSLVSLGLFIPSLAVAMRRLHDINKSGWWVLIGLIPLIGWIILIIWYVKRGDPTENQYGSAPDGSAGVAL